jgi:Ca2+-binding RTX toxin-like protein
MANFIGTNGNDNRMGTANNDSFSPLLGKDTLDGADGEDELVINYAALGRNITLSGNNYGDGFFNQVIFYNIEKFNVTSGSGSDALQGGTLADTLLAGAGNDVLSGNSGLDVIDGGVGIDTWKESYSGLSVAVNVFLTDVVINGNTTASVKLGSAAGSTVRNIEALSLQTGSKNDVISSAPFAYNDNIVTNDGDDSINVGTGGRDYVHGGNGIDLGIFNWSTSTSDITVSPYYDDYADDEGRYVNFDDVNRFDLKGGAGNDYLAGDVYNDSLVGNAGNDSLDGGRGVDSIDGGMGIDQWKADYSTATNVINVQLSGVLDENAVKAGIVGAVVKNVERLEFITGSGNDIISTTPFAYNDSIWTNDGDDTINVGKGGSDYVHGGNGVDLGIFDWSASITDITVDPYYDDYADEEGRYVNFDDVNRFDLKGGSGNDHLAGDVYNDVLRGNAGSDILNGGRGSDLIDGGSGVDLWKADYSTAAAVINIQLSKTLDANGVKGGISGGVVKNVEHLDFTSGSGNDVISTAAFAYNDKVWTNDGSDTINVGKGGNDYVHGGNGVDLGVFDWSASKTNIRVDPYYDDYSDGEGRYVNFDAVERFNLKAGSGNDYLAGDIYKDTLSGGLGRDTLNSGSDADVIDGGGGVDLWKADYSGSTADINIQLSASSNVNAIKSGMTGGVVKNSERLELVTGTGDDVVATAPFAYNDDIRTNAGDDTINVGTGGYDYVHGGDGIDLGLFDWSASTTAITVDPYYDDYSDSEGRFVNFDAIDRFNLKGGSGNDYLAGDIYSDTLSGGDGYDTLDGFAGNDLIIGGNGGDTFTMRNGTGQDVIQDFNFNNEGDLVYLTYQPFPNMSFAAIQDNMQQVGADVVLTLSETDSIIFTGTTLADFAASDFYW